MNLTQKEKGPSLELASDIKKAPTIYGRCFCIYFHMIIISRFFLFVLVTIGYNGVTLGTISRVYILFINPLHSVQHIPLWVCYNEYNERQHAKERKGRKMNILEYIDELIEQGYSEEDAERCADCLFSVEFESDDYDYETPEDYYGD